MIYVSKVRTNIKKCADVELFEKTLIIGPTGAGKSTITDAIALALSGSGITIADKEYSVVAEMMKAKSVNADPEEPLFAVAELSDGTKCDWSANGSTAKASRPKHSISPSVGSNSLPLRNIKDAFNASQDALREVFMRCISASIGHDNILAILEGDAKEEYQLIGLRLLSNENTPAFLALDNLIDTAQKKKKEASAAIKRFSAGGSDGTVSVSVPPSKETIDTAEADVDRLGKRCIEASKAVGAIGSEISAATRIVPKSIAGATVPPMFKVVTELIKVVDHADKINAASCPICKVATGPGFMRNRAAELRSKAQNINAQFEAHASIVERPQVPAQLQELMNNAQLEFTNARNAYQSALTSLQNLREQRVAFENSSRERKLKAKAEKDLAHWNLVYNACRDASDKLLESGVSSVIERVQKYLPTNKHFHVQLVAGERRVCHVGFLDSSKVLTSAISDGEKCLLFTAMACALSENEDLRVVIPPDVSMDPLTLSDMLDALASAPVQVIITSTTVPASIPETWKVIETWPARL